ncbi:Xaa-Pro dipeptidyl-peptidase [Streptococcus moroccensis]|uniref:Xaa-Pro dipeptidyl-peptidase n=1 Tax=Streptococcus moroccensis TaxID=1451356 RepID=A0ABT9YT58_9STRE|nr:Xaa-Pro dipeptidyl-peptidase [Streptococcus moroccensis]MDQ0222960.1 X-Pro dipeptidyl-peptidase [Streptococcus moroccensis]
MRYNQFSYTPVSKEQMLKELQGLGFALSADQSDKANLETFVRKTFFNYTDTDYPLSTLLADENTDLLDFFQSDRPLTDDIFYQVALQLLGFVPGVDYDNLSEFLEKLAFPITYGDVITNIYQLLNTRKKSGNTLIDHLVAQDLIPQDNSYHFFNGKVLSSFTTHNLIREVVYVETRLDTDDDGEIDLVKVNIVRPRYDGKVPAIITNSPYQQGINDVASDKALYKMAGDLLDKESRQITVRDPRQPELLAGTAPAAETYEAEETFTYQGRFTTINDYFLSRGMANIYVSGIGTLGSQGMMTSGDYRQIQSFKAVIDWLNGRAVAFTSHKRDKQVLATWSNGKVATSGISYLGTLSTGLATTGVDGLEVIMAEAGIASWYDYYRENGLVVSPGGYPGEDLDSLAELTYSKSLQAGDFLKTKDAHKAFIAQMARDLNRDTGDFNQFWQDRNYLPHIDKIKAEVVYTHGLQDWNVKPVHVYNVFKRLLPETKKHLFLHLGEHVYMNNWQSIDYRESMNALLSQRLLGHDSAYSLPEVIWQDNTALQSWQTLDAFGSEKQVTLSLGDKKADIENQYAEETFARYDKDFNAFKQDLFMDKANQVTVDLTLEEDLFLNGPIDLELRVKSSTSKGFVSAQVLDFGPAKRITSIPMPIAPRSVDNGRNFAQEDLRELAMPETPYRVVTKGHLNLQNRTDLMTVEPVTPDTWMTVNFALQPTVYKFKKGDTIRIVLYTTDFEHTVRDNHSWQITVDLAKSQIHLPVNVNSQTNG